MKALIAKSDEIVKELIAQSSDPAIQIIETQFILMDLMELLMEREEPE